MTLLPKQLKISKVYPFLHTFLVIFINMIPLTNFWSKSFGIITKIGKIKGSSICRLLLSPWNYAHFFLLYESLLSNNQEYYFNPFDTELPKLSYSESAFSNLMQVSQGLFMNDPQFERYLKYKFLALRVLPSYSGSLFMPLEIQF